MTLRRAYEAGYKAALEKLALDPPTQVDSFVAKVESGKDMPFDPSMQVPENTPGVEGENPEAPILPQDEAMALGQPTGKLAFSLGSVAPYAIGAGIPLATAGGLLLAKPGVQSSIKEKLTAKGDTQSKDVKAEIPEPVKDVAARVDAILRERGLDPKQMSIAVDAPPGTGKSVLSRAMAERMGLGHYGLDWVPEKSWSGSHIEKVPHAPQKGEVLEHHNLLRTHDPELFDAAIHIQKSPEEIKKQIIRRGRSSGLADFYDYPKTLGVGGLAFDTLAGEPIDIGGGAMLKLRPAEGWGTENLDRMLSEKGIDPEGMSRHEKLLSLYSGKAESGKGWLPYAKSPYTGLEKALIAGSIPAGVLAAIAAKKAL